MSQPAAPLRVLIVDDEPLAHDVLKAYVARVAHLQLVGQCYTALEALTFLHQNPVDVLLLDLNMPEMTGLELLRALPRPPHTILTTAYSEFALESYEFGVVDYLLKPVSLPRFLKAVAKLPTAALGAVASVPMAAAPPAAPAALLLRDGTTTHRVLPADIRWLEAYGNYVKVQTTTGRLVVNDSFRHLLGQLAARRRFHAGAQVLRRALAPRGALRGQYAHGSGAGTAAGRGLPAGVPAAVDGPGRVGWLKL